MIKYKSTKEGKKQFVSDILSPLIKKIDIGWFGAIYETEGNEEYIYLLTEDNVKARKICVTGNSIGALVEDVSKKWW